jgi:hypothetical protein
MAKLSDYKTQRVNANKHTERGIAALDNSIKRDGWIGAVTVAADGETFDGSARLEALADAMPSVEPIIVESDGTRPVIVRRTDIPDTDDPRAKRLGVAANVIAHLDYAPDGDILAMIAADDEAVARLIRQDEMSEEAVKAALADGLLGDADAEPQIDRAAELNEKWQVKTGDLWRIGDHRLLCGDSKISAQIDRVVCGDSVAFVSDVPYGIDVDTSWLSALNVKRGKQPNKNDDKLANDDGTLDLSWAYKFKEWLVFGFPFVARDEAYTGLLVWDKRGDGGENGLGNPVEVAASNAFTGYRLARHVWAGYVREAGEKREDHPTQKPLGIMVDAIKLVKNQNILDPFVGSGTTLVACQNLQRKCRAVEISPNYCAVILERMITAFPDIVIERQD